jgi:hypothetical protein
MFEVESTKDRLQHDEGSANKVGNGTALPAREVWVRVPQKLLVPHAPASFSNKRP